MNVIGGLFSISERAALQDIFSADGWAQLKGLDGEFLNRTGRPLSTQFVIKI